MTSVTEAIPGRATLRRLRRSRLAANTLIVAGGTAGRLLLQIALFIVVARLLGPADYGAFIAVTALVAIVSTFSGLSCEVVLVKRVARDRAAFATAFGHGLVMLLATAPALTALSLAGALLLVGTAMNWWLVVVVALGDLLFLRITLLCAACYQALERVGWSAVMNVGLGICRLAAALLAVGLTAGLDLETWAIFYGGSALAAAALACAVVVSMLGAPRFTLLRDEINFGFHSSLQSALYFTLRDVDKPLLARLATLEAAGIYAAAFRIADAAIVPIRSLMYAAYASFFRHGAGGVGGSSRFALRILPFAAAYGVAAGVVLVLMPYAVPWILGNDYDAAGEVLLLFALLPLLHAVYNIGGDALTASGHQSARSTAHMIGAALMVIGCLVLIPRYGALGAAAANVASHAALATATWALVLWHRGRDAPASAVSGGAA